MRGAEPPPGEGTFRPIVGRLMELLDVGGEPDEYAQLLAQHVSSEAMSAVGMDLVCRKLRERAARPEEFDAHCQSLREDGVREVDRVLHLMQKLAEDKAVLTMLGDGSTAAAGASPASATSSAARRDGRALLPHQRSSAGIDAFEAGSVSSEDSPVLPGATLSPASMKQLNALTLTPPSGGGGGGGAGADGVRRGSLGAGAEGRALRARTSGQLDRENSGPTPPAAAWGARAGAPRTSSGLADAGRALAARPAAPGSGGADGAPPPPPQPLASRAAEVDVPGRGGAPRGGARAPEHATPASAGAGAGGARAAAAGGGGGGRPGTRAAGAASAARAAAAADASAGGAVPLGTLPPAAQEHQLVSDLLSALLGIETPYIVMRSRALPPELAAAAAAASGSGPPPARAVSFALHPTLCAEVDPALAELVGRMLPLCAHYVQVEHFATAATSDWQRGLVCHALGAAIRELAREHVVLVAQLEAAFARAELGAQRMWWYVQPAMHTLGTLDRLCTAAAASAGLAEGRGGALLATVHAQGVEHAGTTQAEQLFAHLLERASVPLQRMLAEWLSDGRVDDPYGEFFVAQNTSLQRDNIRVDYNDRYWQLRFTLREGQLPPFLRHVAHKVLAAGKYVHVLRECGVPLDARPPPPFLAHPSRDGGYFEGAISSLHAHVSALLLQHLLGERKLIEVLSSLKHYLLLDQGDFFVHFLDIAEPELIKDVDDIAEGRLASFLELALRASTAAHDPHRERLSCKLLPYNLTNQLLRIIHASGSGAEGGAAPPAEPHPSARVPGLDAFTFEFEVEWPLCIVVSRHALVKYQLLFRHLFHCKHVERQLSGAWLSQQGVKELPVARALFPAYTLRQRMLHFLHNLQYYMVYEVMEPRWHALLPRVRAAHSVDEVVSHHNDFLDACLKEVMLRDAHLLKMLAKLLTVCVLFADYTAVVMGSVEAILAAAELSHQNVRRDSAHAPGKMMPQGKRRQMHIAVASQHIRAILAEKKYVESVLRFEQSFTHSLTELMAKLQLRSAGDWVLANLVARLDYNGFYAHAHAAHAS